jgi:SAM-dependent methyltransferase
VTSTDSQQAIDGIALRELIEAPTPSELSTLYRQRFSERDLETKRAMWQVLAERVFQPYLPPDGTVVDLGAGNCELVNSLVAARRVAVDLNPDTKRFAGPGVEVLLTSSEDLSALDNASVDAVFTSNFFEHLPNKDALLSTLEQAHRVLKPAGRLVVLMPNIRYLPGRYWDYFDHHLPLTHLSLSEGLELAGFEVQRVVPRFLPYTVKDSPVRVPAFVVSVYLSLPIVWPIFGRQMLVVGARR